VKDRLPEIKNRGKGKNPCSEAVLAYHEGGIRVARRWICGKEEFFLSDDDGQMGKRGDITHWMPLPLKPEEPQEGTVPCNIANKNLT